MLSQRSISVSCLIVWIGISLGLGLLVLAQITNHDDFARWGIVIICLACTYSVHRRLDVRDARVRDAFEMGREHERTRDLSAVR